MHMLTEDESLAVTAMSGVNDTRNHLQRLLNHTRLKGISWINLTINEVHFEFLNNHGTSNVITAPSPHHSASGNVVHRHSQPAQTSNP